MFLGTSLGVIMLIFFLRFVDFFLFNQLKEVKDLFLKISLAVQKCQKCFTAKNNYNSFEQKYKIMKNNALAFWRLY